MVATLLASAETQPASNRRRRHVETYEHDFDADTEAIAFGGGAPSAIGVTRRSKTARSAEGPRGHYAPLQHGEQRSPRPEQRALPAALFGRMDIPLGGNLELPSALFEINRIGMPSALLDPDRIQEPAKHHQSIRHSHPSLKHPSLRSAPAPRRTREWQAPKPVAIEVPKPARVAIETPIAVEAPRAVEGEAAKVEILRSRGLNALLWVGLGVAAIETVLAGAFAPSAVDSHRAVASTPLPTDNVSTPVLDRLPAPAATPAPPPKHAGAAAQTKPSQTPPPTTKSVPAKPATTAAPSGNAQTGKASFYDYKSGGCAHRTLPMGTVVTVTNTKTGASTTCTVNDRGPFISGRIIDLNRDVFARIASTSSGVADVKITW